MMYIHAHHLGKSLVNGSVAIEDEKLTCVEFATMFPARDEYYEHHKFCLHGGAYKF